MTDPTPGPEPTLAALLDELIDEATNSQDIGGAYLFFGIMPESEKKIAELRATILARFGGDGDFVLVSREDLELLFEMGDWTMQHVDYDGYVRVCKVLSKTPNDPPGRLPRGGVYG